MANNLFISYDLFKPGQDYDQVIGEIKTLGSWAKIHYSLWYVRSDLTASDARARVWKAMDANDKLIVIDVKNNNAAWQNLDPTVSQFIHDNWVQ